MAPFTLPRDTPDPGTTNMFSYEDSPRLWNIVTVSTCLSISTICVCMRMYSKFVIIRSPGWEDYTCFLAWLGLAGYSSVSLVCDKHGSGIHEKEISEADIIEFSKLANASQIVYGPLIFITKLSILLLYLRVFAPSFKSKTYFFIQLLIWFNFCFYLADTVVKIFECTPRKKIWDKNTEGTCININIPILVTSAINVASDFQILLLPIICVWRLQMKPSRKLGISGIFAAGFFGCIASLLRLIVSVQNSSSDDKTYDWFPEFLWTTAEIACGIIASCLPALPTFFRYFFRRAVTRISQFSTKSSTGAGRLRSKPCTRSHQSQKWSGRGAHATEMSSWELDDAPIFQGISYTTTEAKAEPATSAAANTIALTAIDAGHVLNKNPKGILKTVEVDVECEPGEQISLK